MELHLHEHRLIHLVAKETQKIDRHFAEKIRVFEICQHSEVDADAERDPKFFPEFAFCKRDEMPYQEIGCSGEHKQREPHSVCFVIEIERKKYYIYYSRILLIAQLVVYDIERGEQEQEQTRAEHHGRVGLVFQDFAKFAQRKPVKIIFQFIQHGLHHF